MYRLVTFAVLMFLLTSIAGATTSLSADGSWWNGLSPESQGVAAAAFTDSYQSGYLSGYYQALTNVDSETTKALKGLNVNPAFRTAVLHANLAAVHDSAVPHFGKAFKTYTDGITSFYSSHPDAMDMTVGQVLACIQDNPTQDCNQLVSMHKLITNLPKH